MSLWAVYSDRHAEIDLGGDRDSLRQLAGRLSSDESSEMRLDDPPAEWMDDRAHPIEAIRFAPSESSAELILLRREGALLVIAGGGAVERVIGGSLFNLADSPYRVRENSVPTHMHLDPSSDPQHVLYSPDSTAITVHLADEE